MIIIVFMALYTVLISFVTIHFIKVIEEKNDRKKDSKLKNHKKKSGGV